MRRTGLRVGVAGVRVEHLRSEWETPGFALGEDNFVAEEDGRVVGYAAVSPAASSRSRPPTTRLADELLERIVARARGAATASLAVTVASRRQPALAPRRAASVRARARDARSMWRPLGAPVEEPSVPEGVTIRTFRPEDAEAVHVLLDEAYRAWDPLYVPLAHGGLGELDDWRSRVRRGCLVARRARRSARRLRAALVERLAEGPRRPRTRSADAGSAPRSSRSGSPSSRGVASGASG